jgi:hypothetical protein
MITGNSTVRSSVSIPLDPPRISVSLHSVVLYIYNHVCGYLNITCGLINTSPQDHYTYPVLLLVQSIVQIHVYWTPWARLVPIRDTGASPALIALFDWSHPRISGKVIPTISPCALVLAYNQCGQRCVFNWREEAVGADKQFVVWNPYLRKPKKDAKNLIIERWVKLK